MFDSLDTNCSVFFDRGVASDVQSGVHAHDCHVAGTLSSQIALGSCGVGSDPFRAWLPPPLVGVVALKDQTSIFGRGSGIRQ